MLFAAFAFQCESLGRHERVVLIAPRLLERLPHAVAKREIASRATAAWPISVHAPPRQRAYRACSWARSAGTDGARSLGAATAQDVDHRA